MSSRPTVTLIGSGVIALYALGLLRKFLADRIHIRLIGSRPSERADNQRDLFINSQHCAALTDLGIDLPPQSAPIKRIELEVAGWDNQLNFDALASTGNRSFGQVIQLAALRRVMFDALVVQPNVHYLEDDLRTCTVELIDGDQVTLNLQGQNLPTDLLLLTDRHAVVDQMRIFTPSQSAYGQTALSGVLELEGCRPDSAWQRFFASGPLAVLPLAQQERNSYIWTLDEAQARLIHAMSSSQRADLIAEHLSHRFGKVREVRAYRPARLMWRTHRRLRVGRTVLLGEAAQIVHPMAGIGANSAMFAVARLVARLTERDDLSVPSSWDREMLLYGRLLHQLLTGIRRLSPQLASRHWLARGLNHLGNNMLGVLSGHERLRRLIVQVANPALNLPTSDRS